MIHGYLAILFICVAGFGLFASYKANNAGSKLRSWFYLLASIVCLLVAFYQYHLLLRYQSVLMKGAFKERPGIQVDSATGCQYLVASNGSLTPRLDSTGKQVCR